MTRGFHLGERGFMLVPKGFHLGQKGFCWLREVSMSDRKDSCWVREVSRSDGVDLVVISGFKLGEKRSSTTLKHLWFWLLLCFIRLCFAVVRSIDVYIEI